MKLYAFWVQSSKLLDIKGGHYKERYYDGNYGFLFFTLHIIFDNL